jgi:translocator protein
MKPLTRTTVIVNTVGLTAVLVVNFLSNSLPLNGHTPGELSDMYPNFFVPAGLTFSIWGIIYTGLIIWVGFQIRALFSATAAARMEPIIEKSSPWFILSCFLNILWLFAWHWQQNWPSVVIMSALLLTLIKLNLSIRSAATRPSTAEKWHTWLPLGIYQGWITVAIIANVTAALVGSGTLSGHPQEALIAAVMVSIGAAVALAMVFRQNNVGHGLAVAWALFGIWIKQNAIAGDDHQLVAGVALTAMALVTLVTLIRLPHFIRA